MKYDVLVIGAGLSGLAAAIRLARFGKRVCVFERHALPGGLNSWYPRNGSPRDVGLHAMTNYVPEDVRSAPFPLVLRQLQIPRHDLELLPQSVSRIEFPQNVLVLNNDFAAFRRQIAEDFPESLDGFDELCRRLIPYGEYSTAASQSTREILAQLLPSPRLRDMLLMPVMFYGSATEEDMDFPRFSVLFQSIFKEGFMRPRNGIRPLLDALLQKLKANGGEIRFRNGIASLECENGRICAVRDDLGQLHTADLILSCAGSVETAGILRNAPENTILGQAKPSSVCFLEAVFQLKCHPAELGINSCILFRSTVDAFSFRAPSASQKYSLDAHLITCPGNYQGADATERENRTLRFSAMASADFWLNASQEEYARAKKETADAIMTCLKQRIPCFAENMLEWEMFTPRTIRRFTGHSNGCIYGSAQKFADGKTGIENLRLTGTDQGLLGIVGSLVSGTVVANSLLI